jgi:hypothetical protein
VLAQFRLRLAARRTLVSWLVSLCHFPFSPFDDLWNLEFSNACQLTVCELDLPRFNTPKLVGFPRGLLHASINSRLVSGKPSATANFFRPPHNRLCLLRLPEVSRAELSRASAINARPVWFRVTEDLACDVNSSVESCIFAMSWHQVRQIPIVDQDHRVVGILSKGDLERFLCEQCEETRTA